MNYTRRRKPLLGTFVEIGAANINNYKTHEAVNQSFSLIEHLQNNLSFHNPDSDVTRINLSRGEWISVTASVGRVIRLAQDLMKRTNGLFNPLTGGALVAKGILPDHSFGEFDAIGALDDMEIQGSQVRLRRPVLLCLDGIAKGFIVDMAVRFLERKGVHDGWVNAGGDMRSFGTATIPIHRKNHEGHLQYLGGLHQAAIATSTWRETPDIREPGFIVAKNQVNPVEPITRTVLAHHAWKADALTKIALLATPEQTDKLFSRYRAVMIS